MINRYFLIILIITIFSCEKRLVQLPETDFSAITEPSDISPIYMFYVEEDGSCEFNRNNMIGTTNWLVNIDKRLNLEQILPHLQYLQEKRGKKSMHKNESARNYFSCSNPEIQNLAFIDFTGVTYSDMAITEFISSRSQPDSLPQCYINFKELDEITIGKNFILKKTDSANLLDDLREQTETDSLPDRIYLNFNAGLSFQDYITIKSELLKTDSSRVLISDTEFIYK